MQKERLLEQKAVCERMIQSAQQNFADHILKHHRGVPATSCHTCINYKGLSRAQQADLNEITQAIQDAE